MSAAPPRVWVVVGGDGGTYGTYRSRAAAESWRDTLSGVLADQGDHRPVHVAEYRPIAQPPRRPRTPPSVVARVHAWRSDQMRLRAALDQMHDEIAHTLPPGGLIA